MKKYSILLLILSFATGSFAQRNYTAGEIQSKVEVTYGRFEIMMYSSDVSGTTSTFFMWKNGGNEATIRWNELDIETFGKSADTWQSNPIWEYNGNDTDIKRWEETHSGLPIANTWVKFTLEWTPNYVAWYNNDIEVRRIVKGENVPASHFRYNNGDSDDPVGYIADAMRMAFNHWATFPGEWLGTWNEADLPSYQFVDWLTYQKWNGTGFDAVSVRQDFDNISDITNNYTISTHTFTENQCQFSTKAVGVTNGFMWLGIFKSGQEVAPAGNQIPTGGVDPVVYNHLLPKKVEAEEFNSQVGLQTEAVVATEGTGLNLAYTNVDDYAEYAIEVPTTGNYSIDFRVASLNGNAGLSISVDGTILIAEVPVETTGGWQNWETVRDTISLTAGKHTLQMTVTKEGFNLNWMDIQYITELPELNFTNIENNQIFAPSTDLDINVSATHPAGIENVQLFVDGVLLRQENTAPYDWGLGTNDASLNALASGTHTFKAIATAISGESAEISRDIMILFQQTIALKEGWNMISIFVVPADNSISKLFYGLEVQEIKTADVFWRKTQAELFNSLKTIVAGEGYLVNMKTAGILTVTSVSAVEPQSLLSQHIGWNIIGCPYQTQTPFSTDFNTTNCQLIKNFEGFWEPSGTANSIENIEPGKAYFFKHP